MAIGNKSVEEIIAALGEAVRMGDKTLAKGKLEVLRRELLLSAGIASIFGDYERQRNVINSNLGYITGYMPQEYGNMALELLDVEHPVFGRRLDATADEALAAGMRLAEQLRETKLAEERRKKLAEKRAAGLDIPDASSAVSSESAKTLLAAIRASKTGAILAPVTDADSAFGHIEVEEREVPLNALEKLAGKKTKAEVAREALEAKLAAAASEDEEEEYLMNYEEDEPVPDAVIEVDHAKEAANRERLLRELEDAGSF